MPWERGVRMLNTAGRAARKMLSGTKILTGLSGANYSETLSFYNARSDSLSTSSTPTLRNSHHQHNTAHTPRSPSLFSLSSLFYHSFPFPSHLLLLIRHVKVTRCDAVEGSIRYAQTSFIFSSSSHRLSLGPAFGIETKERKRESGG